MAITGVTVLSEIDWRTLHIGRGELETLAAAVLFTGQILWLQKPAFARNNVNRFTLIMFAVISLACLPVAVVTGRGGGDWMVAMTNPSTLGFMAILTIFCTLTAYLLMNYWQPFLSATQAGLIYCVEPVAASLFALFLPGWFSALAGINYPNEQPGPGLLVGGGLITFANLLMQLQPAHKREDRKNVATQIGR
jgi:drug/metabolite transporter (DMT)-like permease